MNKNLKINNSFHKGHRITDRSAYRTRWVSNKLWEKSPKTYPKNLSYMIEAGDILVPWNKFKGALTILERRIRWIGDGIPTYSYSLYIDSKTGVSIVYSSRHTLRERALPSLELQASKQENINQLAREIGLSQPTNILEPLQIKYLDRKQ